MSFSDRAGCLSGLCSTCGVCPAALAVKAGMARGSSDLTSAKNVCERLAPAHSHKVIVMIRRHSTGIYTLKTQSMSP